ncbi:LPS export ABC transporter periplasmic protein LptC [Thorsellia anophelis]|uniref:Lipopolysaccharide export system protein LptC n=1 Tax=Thorsellia anophelis DSM 18579 TaxID=1123402 RepID=A0A1I0A9S9_9GAMM|nr:LPS export ABC transporter periplasmic protein LptC [Thorsellia anophelis]SES90792.1 lipopolysaccharide export system protein LptC [Thorsellia anophelis DSM 18579]
MNKLYMTIKDKGLTILLILVALTLIGIKFADMDTNDNLNEEPNEDSPTYIATETKTLAYDELGKLSHELLAKFAKNRADSGKSELKDPILIIFGETGKPDWKVSAERADIDENRLLFLQGNVKVNRLEAVAILDNIVTESASIDLNTQDIMSEVAVTLEGDGFSSKGNGLIGNIKSQQAKLLNNVMSIYQPQTATN